MRPVRRVVVADDNLFVRAGVQALLATTPEIELAGECGTLDELMETVDTTVPDVVVTDIRMPPTGTDEGIRAAEWMRTSHPDIGVVVLSQFVDPGLALALVEHGSGRRGYLLKEHVANTDQLLAAIEAVATGGSFIDPLVIEALLQARTAGRPGRLRDLTSRELDVLQQVATGKTNRAIGDELYIGERAVEKHINSIFSKLGLGETEGVHRRVAAVLVFLTDHTGG